MDDQSQQHRGATATATPDQLVQKLEEPLRKIFGEHVQNIDSINWGTTTREFVSQLRKVGLDVAEYRGPEYQGG